MHCGCPPDKRLRKDTEGENAIGEVAQLLQWAGGQEHQEDTGSVLHCLHFPDNDNMDRDSNEKVNIATDLFKPYSSWHFLSTLSHCQRFHMSLVLR